MAGNKIVHIRPLVVNMVLVSLIFMSCIDDTIKCENGFEIRPELLTQFPSYCEMLDSALDSEEGILNIVRLSNIKNPEFHGAVLLQLFSNVDNNLTKNAVNELSDAERSRLKILLFWGLKETNVDGLKGKTIEELFPYL